MTVRHATEEERAGLQALLRGAKEALSLMPDSPRRDSVAGLADGLAQVLSNEPHEEA